MMMKVLKKAHRQELRVFTGTYKKKKEKKNGK
jgi:hypothetical protein